MKIKIPRRKPIQHERHEQIALFTWAGVMLSRYPELAAMYAIPNGGKRHFLEARNLKLSGVKAGIPDICLPVARQGYYALYLEMKSEKGTLTESQGVMIERLQECGNKVVICKNCEEAIDFIVWYLERAPRIFSEPSRTQ